MGHGMDWLSAQVRAIPLTGLLLCQWASVTQNKKPDRRHAPKDLM
jgi:hypothetical protein